MNARKIAVLLAMISLSACASDSTEPENGVDVSGTWVGDLTLVAGSESDAVNVRLVLAQNGTTVTGTANETTSTDPPDALTGTLVGSTLTLTGTAPSAPCNAYHWSLTFNATSSALTATGASGQICDNGRGSPQLHVLTSSSGTLHK
jgi:hypothetical protein